MENREETEMGNEKGKGVRLTWSTERKRMQEDSDSVDNRVRRRKRAGMAAR